MSFAAIGLGLTHAIGIFAIVFFVGVLAGVTFSKVIRLKRPTHKGCIALLIFLIGIGVPLVVVGSFLIFLYAHFIAPFGTTGLMFFILGGGLVIFKVLGKAIGKYLELPNCKV